MPKQQKNTNSKKSAAQYKKMYAALKPFVDFKIDMRKEISRSDKIKLSKYHAELLRLTDKKPYPLQLFRTTKKDNLKKAQAFGGQNTKLTAFKVAFIPKTAKSQKVKFNKKGEVYLKTENVIINYIPLDAELLATDSAADYVNDVVSGRPEKVFSIQAGEWEITGTYSKSKIGEAVAKLAARYGDNPEANNYFGNWLGGVFAYSFDKQSDVDSYRKNKRDAGLKKTRAASKKAAAVFYFYDRELDAVLTSKKDTPPTPKSEKITVGEYKRFNKTGEI